MFATRHRIVSAFAVAIGLSASVAHADDEYPKIVPPEGVKRLLTPADVSVDGAILRVDGTIIEEAVSNVERLLIAAKSNPVRSLVIKSPGGEAVAGIHFGELVRDWKLAVTVDGYCDSACANYVAIAARELIVPDGAVLGYHGGQSKNWGDDGRYTEAYEKKLRKQHEAMLRKLNAKSLVDLDQLIADQLRREKDTYTRQEALFRSIGVSAAILKDTAPAKIAPATLGMFTREVLERCYNIRNIAQYPTLTGTEIVRTKSTIKIIRDCPAGRP